MDKLLPRVQMLPGENHRDHVLTLAEELRYFDAAQQIGEEILAGYQRALTASAPGCEERSQSHHRTLICSATSRRC